MINYYTCNILCLIFKKIKLICVFNLCVFFLKWKLYDEKQTEFRIITDGKVKIIDCNKNKCSIRKQILS